MPIQDGSKCQEVGFGINPDNQVCAGGEAGKSACRGDSGGGLFIRQEQPSEGAWYLFGIVSFGGFDCVAEVPEAYTRYTDILIRGYDYQHFAVLQGFKLC